ncbi:MULTISPECIES: Dyp-type peroxidase [Kocuria]|uniref:Dyp-type peroxidase family protein n=1 Tax=Kocuria rhizophila (strain ATCC 9341 / DSM 348 / NBRC 103217 / DC2201) TaxID=378753 RepID=B2GG92_KOCRD|nr:MULTISPECIES: Dyp-type peroxidase [Kocuria]ASE11286.1 peroxidase [Kocuria rhizophila]BAG28715.1 Dyp-type peroxidase family protein [Kocuria rhizophila DC2201]VEH75990.1 Probable deferrochelatase/peroxidase EfeN precursor [Kocuria rhizophila]HAG63250.1 peroxidase [Kocuria sp.]
MPTDPSPSPSGWSRRSLLTGAVAGAGATGLGAVSAAALGAGDPRFSSEQGLPRHGLATEPFHGARQAGVATLPQAFSAFVALRLADGATRDSLRRLLRVLTDDAAALTQGRAPLNDQEPWLAENPSRLTVTVGFGPRAMELVDRTRSPSWLRPLPAFGVDRLQPRWGQGDLLIQLCCDDKLTLAHAQRVLLKDVRSFASVKWVQDGFRNTVGATPDGQTTRNLFGQLDGTVNAYPGEPDHEKVVYGQGGFEPWIQDGTSVVIRRIHMNLDTWDEADTPAREDAVGRRLSDGAPLTGGSEHDEPDFEAKGPLGFPVISSYSHVRRSRSENPDEKIFRRVYNYDLAVSNASGQSRSGDVSGGVSNTGLIFASYQSDPDRQFVPIQKRLDELDMLNTWTVPIGSAVFAIPPGCQPGGFIGDVLFN